MTQINQRASAHLRPHTADLNRLLAGEHHDPHSILGAHEYSDHTVIRAYRPHPMLSVKDTRRELAKKLETIGYTVSDFGPGPQQ